MRWIDKLERRFGRYGIPYLMNVILIGQAIVWLACNFLGSYALANLLTLTREGLLHGQIWRLVTFIFVPGFGSGIFGFLLELYFYWWLGNSLQNAWGDFRFTAYWTVGLVGCWLTCLLAGSSGTYGLFLSLFFAYAWMWPNQRLLLFFILPIKVKWLGWAAGVMWALQLVNYLRYGLWYGVLGLIFGLAGFLVFFGPEIWRWCRDEVRAYRRRKQWKDQWK